MISALALDAPRGYIGVAALSSDCWPRAMCPSGPPRLPSVVCLLELVLRSVLRSSYIAWRVGAWPFVVGPSFRWRCIDWHAVEFYMAMVLARPLGPLALRRLYMPTPASHPLTLLPFHLLAMCYFTIIKYVGSSGA